MGFEGYFKRSSLFKRVFKRFLEADSKGDFKED